jgi:hypothetical protein
MSVVVETASFAVPASSLWPLVSNFGAIDKIMDGIEECVLEGEGIGATRTVTTANGQIVESLDALDHEKMTLIYSIVSGPMPFKDYSATVVVTADSDDSCSLTWTGTFEANGVPIEKADRIASSIYRGGIAGYSKALGL